MAKDKFEYLKARYPQAKVFLNYFEKTWMHKIKMWVRGYWNMPHANQDTNVVVESYHANLKAILKSSRQNLVDGVLIG